MEHSEDGFAERDKGSIVIPSTKAAMPNIRLNLSKVIKKIDTPFQVAQSASDEPQSIIRKPIPLSEEPNHDGKVLLKFENTHQNKSAPPRPAFQQALARAQNSQDDGLPEPPDTIQSLNQLYKLLSVNEFCLQIGGKSYKLCLNTHEVLTLQNTNPFSSMISGSEAISRQTGFSAQNSVLSPMPVKIAINVGRPSQLMAAFSPQNAASNPVRVDSSEIKPPAPLIRKSLLSVLKGLDEVPPEIAHPQPTQQADIENHNFDNLRRSFGKNLIQKDFTFTDLKSANCVTRPKMDPKKEQNLLPLQLKQKKTKSQMGQVGKTRQELEAENQQLRNQIKQNLSQPIMNDENQTNELHIGFLFSSPMILRGNTSSKDMLIPQLDFESESKEILAAASESKSNIRFLQAVATQVCFTEMLNRRPKALHISCHGIRNNEETIGLDYKAYRNDGDFLLLERENGEGELVSAKQLRKLIKLYSVKLDLVFVAACKSEFVGRIFQNAGAQHVICVRSDAEVLDKAVLIFTRKFYKNMFGGTTICDAFTRAQADVEFQFGVGQAQMFKILLVEELKVIQSLGLEKADTHVCYQFGPLVKGGQVQNISDKVDVEYIYSPISNLVGRERDLVQLVSKIASGKRLTCLLGLPGIGKSSIVRNAVHFFVKRRFFLAGVVFIQAKGVQTVEVLIKQIIQKLQLKTISEAAKQHIQEKAGSHPSLLTDQIINFVKQKQVFKDNQESIGVFNSQDRKFLLVLDNVELLIEKNLQKFKDFLTRLVNECMHLTVVVTSRSWVVMQDTIPCSTQVLLKLVPPTDIELFLENCGSEVMAHEILDLLKLQTNYPLSQLKLSRQIESWREVDWVIENELLASLGKRQFQLIALSMHDFFQQLGGNPHSIQLMACCRANPEVKRSLSDLYKIVKSDQIQNLLNEEGLDLYNNELSLRISLEISIISVKESSPDAYTLYFFLGLLPGGVTEVQLERLWGKTCHNCYKTLSQFGFFEQGVEKIVLKPFMINFAEEAIDRVSKFQYNLMICEYYLPLIKDCYRNICRKEERLSDTNSEHTGNQYLMRFLSEIRNILSCLGRLLENEKVNNHQDTTQNQSQSNESLVVDERRSDLSSDEQHSDNFSGRKDVDVSPNMAQNNRGEESPIQLDKTIKSSILKTQLLQFGVIEDGISQIDEESKSDKQSDCVSRSQVSESLGLQQQKSKTQGATRASNHSPLQVQSKNSSDDESQKGKMMQTIQQVVLGRPSIRKLRGTINLGITGVKFVDSFQGSNLKISHGKNSSDQSKSEVRDPSLGRDSELIRDQNQVLKLNEKESRRFTVFENPSKKLDLGNNITFTRRATQVENKSRASFQSEERLFENLPLQQKFQILTHHSTFQIKNKKAIKISNTKRRASQFTAATGDSFLGITEMSASEKFKVYVVSSLYLSNDSTSGFEMTQRALQDTSNQQTFIYSGNMLRLHALFLEKINQHETLEQKRSDPIKTQRNILQAIKSLKDALDKFSATKESGLQSAHGVALCNFHLGYIYETHAESLLLPYMVSNQGPLDFRVFSLDEARLIALEYYEKSFESFLSLNHLAGMFTARQAARSCAFLYPEKVIQYTQDYSKFQDQFNRYSHIGDETYCYYVPRDQGEVYSLLVEVVENNKTCNLFRQRPLTMNQKQSSYENKRNKNNRSDNFELKVEDEKTPSKQRQSVVIQTDQKQPLVLKRTQIRLTDIPEQFDGPLSPKQNPFGKKLRIKVFQS